MSVVFSLVGHWCNIYQARGATLRWKYYSRQSAWPAHFSDICYRSCQSLLLKNLLVATRSYVRALFLELWPDLDRCWDWLGGGSQIVYWCSRPLPPPVTESKCKVTVFRHPSFQPSGRELLVTACPLLHYRNWGSRYVRLLWGPASSPCSCLQTNSRL